MNMHAHLWKLFWALTPSGLKPLNTLQIDRTRGQLPGAQRPFFFTALLPWNFILRSGSAFFLLPRFLP